MGLEIKEATLFNKSTFIALKRMFTSLREYMPSGETYDITLLTMPKSLTLKKLKQLIESREHSSDILRIQSDILDEFGDISVEETYRVAMTNEVLDVNTSFSAQNDVDLVIKLGFEVPGLLTATALAVLTYIHRETNFNRTYSPVTVCSEEFSDHSNITVGWKGGFAIEVQFLTQRAHGVGAQLKLKSIQD